MAISGTVVTVRRALAWSCVWVYVVSGCGGRTLPGGYGAVEGDGGQDDDGAASGDASGSGSSIASQSGSHSGGQGGQSGSEGAGQSGADVGASGDGTMFFVCPPRAPTAESPCDSPQRVCVYPDFNGCQSFICSPSHGWQASQLGC